MKHVVPPHWTVAALCAQVDPELWFPESGEDVSAPKKICRACPVRQQCLDEAIVREEQYGIFGGLSVKQRRAYARSRTRVAA